MTVPAEHFRVLQEKDAVRRRTITAVGAAGVIVTLVSIWISGLILSAETSGQPKAAKPSAPGRQIGIVDQTLVEVENHGADVREAQRRELVRYGWADRDAGVAIIPVEKAMDLVVEQAK
jgi:hypothetical protein